LGCVTERVEKKKKQEYQGETQVKGRGKRETKTSPKLRRARHNKEGRQKNSGRWGEPLKGKRKKEKKNRFMHIKRGERKGVRAAGTGQSISREKRVKKNQMETHKGGIGGRRPLFDAKNETRGKREAFASPVENFEQWMWGKVTLGERKKKRDDKKNNEGEKKGVKQINWGKKG